MSPQTVRNLLLVASAAIVLTLACSAAYAAPICYPSNVGGKGAKAVERHNAHGGVLIWRCGSKLEWVGARLGDDLPNLKLPSQQARSAIDAAYVATGYDRNGMHELKSLLR